MEPLVEIVGWMRFFGVCMILALILKVWQLFFKDTPEEYFENTLIDPIKQSDF